MKAKVYKYGAYPHDYQIVVRTIDIEQLTGDVYCYLVRKAVTDPKNDKLGVVLHIGENYFEHCQCLRRIISIPVYMKRIKDIAADYEAFVNSEMQKNQYISIMCMTIYESLGINTTPLIQYREQRATNNIAERAARKLKEEKLYEINPEKQRLATLRQDYIDGKEIKGEDFISICWDDGFVLNTRVLNSLRNSVSSLNKGGTLWLRVKNGKAKPKTGEVRKHIKIYNSFLAGNQ